VRECIDRYSGAQYALKVIDKTKSGLDAPADHEVRILKSVTHPNIIHLFEDYDFENELFVIMEHVSVSYFQSLTWNSNSPGNLSLSSLFNAIINFPLLILFFMVRGVICLTRLPNLSNSARRRVPVSQRTLLQQFPFFMPMELFIGILSQRIYW